jgi:hypothetical protein
LLTETAPAGTDGVKMHSIESIVPAITAEAGQTFTGTGTLLGYVYVTALAAWVRAPHSDFDLSDYAGLAQATLPALPVESATGLFQLVPSGVGVSGGTTLTVDYVCTWRKA